MNTYVIAFYLEKQVMNTLCERLKQYVIDADNSNEALGKALVLSTKEFEGFSLKYHVWSKIESSLNTPSVSE